jgi:hypothetical protein
MSGSFKRKKKKKKKKKKRIIFFFWHFKHLGPQLAFWSISYRHIDQRIELLHRIPHKHRSRKRQVLGLHATHVVDGLLRAHLLVVLRNRLSFAASACSRETAPRLSSVEPFLMFLAIFFFFFVSGFFFHFFLAIFTTIRPLNSSNRSQTQSSDPLVTPARRAVAAADAASRPDSPLSDRPTFGFLLRLQITTIATTMQHSSRNPPTPAMIQYQYGSASSPSPGPCRHLPPSTRHLLVVVAAAIVVVVGSRSRTISMSAHSAMLGEHSFVGTVDLRRQPHHAAGRRRARLGAVGHVGDIGRLGALRRRLDRRAVNHGAVAVERRGDRVAQAVEVGLLNGRRCVLSLSGAKRRRLGRRRRRRG